MTSSKVYGIAGPLIPAKINTPPFLKLILQLLLVARPFPVTIIKVLRVKGFIMTKAGKLLNRFKTAAGPFKWVDLIAVPASLGFKQMEGAGSRVSFTNGTVMIKLHKPHPQKEVKAYAVKQVKEVLKREGLL